MKSLLANTVDDLDVNKAAFELQQAAEFLLKKLFVDAGLPYPHTHNIDVLLRSTMESGLQKACDPELWEVCDEYSEMITAWGANTRDDDNYFAKYKSVLKVYSCVEKVFERLFGKPSSEYKLEHNSSVTSRDMISPMKLD